MMSSAALQLSPGTEIEGLRIGAHHASAALFEARDGTVRRVDGHETLWPRLNADKLLVLVSGIPRAGTSWLDRITRNLLRTTGLALEGGDGHDDYPTNALGDAEDQRLRAALLTHRFAPEATRVAKTHFYPGSRLTSGPHFRVVYVWRDLRDVMASTCVYARHGPAAEIFGAMPRDKAFHDVIARVLPTAAASLRAIATQIPENTLVLTYEGMHGDLPATIRGMARHLQITLPEGFATGIAHRHGFRRESGRPPGDVDPTSYFRSGTIGRFREVLTPAHLAQIDRLVPDLVDLQRSVRARSADQAL